MIRRGSAVCRGLVRSLTRAPRSRQHLRAASPRRVTTHVIAATHHLLVVGLLGSSAGRPLDAQQLDQLIDVQLDEVIAVDAGRAQRAGDANTRESFLGAADLLRRELGTTTSGELRCAPQRRQSITHDTMNDSAPPHSQRTSRECSVVFGDEGTP